MNEIEAKAIVKNLEPMIKVLVNMGCTMSEPSLEVDTYYRHTDVESPTSEGDIVLRIREKGGKKIFTLKKVLRTVLSCTEHETEIDNEQEMDRIILCLDYVEFVKVTKTRIKTHYDGLEICLDKIDGLGNFIEVEKMTEDANEKEIQDELWKFLRELGVNENSRIEKGYSTLMREAIEAQ